MMLPLCFTQISAIVDFTETGQIGDTIGGITAPFFCNMFYICYFFSILDSV